MLCLMDGFGSSKLRKEHLRLNFHLRSRYTLKLRQAFRRESTHGSMVSVCAALNKITIILIRLQ